MITNNLIEQNAFSYALKQLVAAIPYLPIYQIVCRCCQPALAVIADIVVCLTDVAQVRTVAIWSI